MENAILRRLNGVRNICRECERRLSFKNVVKSQMRDQTSQLLLKSLFRRLATHHNGCTPRNYPMAIKSYSNHCHLIMRLANGLKINW